MSTSLKYLSSQGSPTLLQSVIVYMDILGYTEIIRNAELNGTSQSQLEELYAPLKNAREYLEDAHIEHIAETPPRRFDLKSFSDNIVMGWPIRDSTPSGAGQPLLHALKKVSRFQLDMATKGFFVRGAIAVGDIFIDDMAVYGTGLLDAIDGEEKFAITPRIILLDSAIDVEKRYRAAYGINGAFPVFPLSPYICTDNDGRRFVNYLDTAVLHTTVGVHQLIMKHQTIVASKLNEFKSKPKELQKFDWVAGYHNSFCDRYIERFGPYKIACNETSRITFSDG